MIALQHEPIHSVLRPLIALLAAMTVTGALFYLMTSLIESGYVRLDETPATRFVEFVRVPDNPPEVATTAPPQQPPPPEIEPTRPNISLETGDGFTGKVATVLEPPLVEVTIGGLSDGAHLPLVKVQPNYPRNALARGIEGYVIVEFDLATDGSVRNPRVIESYPSSIFDHAALKAVMKFRYKPMVENGHPVTVPGVQNRFVFELSK